jgi:putative transposase
VNARYEQIQNLKTAYSVREMCQCFNVSRSGYYEWSQRKPSSRMKEDERIAEAIRQIDEKVRSRYGRPRMHRQLKHWGIQCGHKRVGRLMKAAGIKVRQKKAWRPRTTDSNHRKPVAPNLLKERGSPQQPGEAWAADITYIPMAEGWAYLAVVEDLCSRKIVGWSLDTHMRSTLVEAATKAALGRNDRSEKLLHHSDRGSQYASEAFRKLLGRHRIESSMSRKANCYDNAAVESFFGTLKTELLPDCGYFQDAGHARREIFEYIEVFYNRERLHSSLGYQSPVDFEATFN